jgi:hypothetical protein
MQATGALSFRALANKIHPHLPLNPRESSHLLVILTTSFNKQLDRHHPTTASSSRIGNNALQSNSTSSPQQSTPHLSSLSQLSAAVSANDHLSSLLSSPLLSKKPRAASFSKSNIVASAAPFRLDQQLRWLEDRIASATVTLGDFAVSLKTIRGALANQPEITVKAIKESSAGSKIVRWLRTSGRTSEKDIMLSGKEPALLRNILIDILVIEGRQIVVWEWLKSASLVPQRSVFSRLLFAEIQYGSGVEAAMLTFLNASRYGYHGPRRAATIASHYLSASFPIVSSEVFLRFLTAIRTQPENSFACAVMSLFHPDRPSTKEAMAYVTAQSNKFAISGKIDIPQGLRSRHVAFYLSLSRILLSKDEAENADFVLRFAQEHFQRELGIEERQLDLEGKTSKAASEPPAWTGTSEEELANMQQLDGLLAT